MDFDRFGKLPGKTKFSGVRRTTTRTSGFSSHPESTGGELKVSEQPTIHLEPGQTISVRFSIPKHSKGDIVAYGGWYVADPSVEVSRLEAQGSRFQKHTLTQPKAPNWSKFGSMAISETGESSEIVICFTATEKSDVGLFNLGCGIVSHKHLDRARPELMRNMYQFSPEANFYKEQSSVVVESPEAQGHSATLFLKSCNRCARLLPINIDNELFHLSFSNHCKAEHRRPCSHSGFGRLTNIDTGEKVQLEYGYQLECRFCKKFEVNAAHNPQRTAAQMKEDGARRRSLELLLTELMGGSPQLRYRHQTNGRELSDDIWNKFGRRCFNCGQLLYDQKKMHLDHTRPLALLWPLDATATCLCGSCNSEKRDRSPANFYIERGKLEALSEITQIPLSELKKPTPNLAAIILLYERLDWFFNEFCMRSDLTKERDGKVAVELLIKAIQKTLNKCPGGAPFNIIDEYERRRG